MDVVRQIHAFNTGRDPERLALKYRAMRASTFAFLRGSCHLFYDRLPASGLFKSAPLAWCCGDLHFENFGSYKADNRLVYFDINDFDEAALAPVSWDLVRLLSSLWVGAEQMSIQPPDARMLCHEFVQAYAASLEAGKAYWVERDTAEGLVRSLLNQLRERQRPAFLDARTKFKGKRRVLRVDGLKALPASQAQRAAVQQFVSEFARTQPHPEFYEVLDAARRIAGTGSLGVDRYVILVRGKGSPDRNYLLDLKRALPSALLRRLKPEQPVWLSQAHRIVSIQQRMQAVPMAFLQAVLLDEDAYVLRGLQPAEDRIALDRAHASLGELRHALATMGRLLAWDQLRSSGREGSAGADELMAYGQRRKWREKLIDLSRACAEQVRADASVFNAAYDDGVLGV